MADYSLGVATLGTEVDLDGLDAGMGDAASTAQKGGDQAGSAWGGAFQSLMLSAVAVVSTAIIGLGGAMVDITSQSNQAFNDLKATLGATDEEAAKLRDTTLSIYEQGFGESVEDVNKALIETRQQMKLLGDDEIQGATEKALMLRDTFELDVAESTNAANTLMKEFGLTSAEAYDFITKGQQDGLNTSGDFLETVGEYAVQFKESGASAAQFYSAMETGLQGGVLGTDKIIDALKESRIRIMEMSDPLLAAYKDIGDQSIGDQIRKDLKLGAGPILIDTAEKAQVVADRMAAMGMSIDPQSLLVPLQIIDEKTGEITYQAQEFGQVFSSGIYESIKSGSMSVADAQQIAIDGLKDMNNEVYQNSAGVAIFGTQWEDAGASAILGIDMAATGLADMAGATDTLTAKYDNWSSFATGVWREFQVGVLLPIGNSLLELANAILPYVKEGIAAISALISGDSAPLVAFASKLGGWIEDAIPGMVAGLELLIGQLLSWAETSLPKWAHALLGFAQQAVSWISAALPGLADELGKMMKALADWVVASLPKWIAELQKLALAAVDWVKAALPDLMYNLGLMTGKLLGWLLDILAKVAPELLKIGALFVAWIVTEVLPRLPGLLWSIGEGIFNFLRGLLDGIGPHIKAIAATFWTWITDEVLPNALAGLGVLWDAIAGWLGQVATDALTGAKAIGAAIADGIAGAVRSGLHALHNLVASIINPIIEGINSTIDGLNIINPLDDIPHIPSMKALARGTSSWGGGPVIAGELGIELGLYRGAASLLGPGVHDLAQGTKVLDHDATMGALGGTTIQQSFGDGIDSTYMRELARAGTQEALDASGREAIIRQQTRIP